MMKKIFIFTVAFLSLVSFSYSQSGYKDPFESLLPQEVEEMGEGQKEIISEGEGSFPSIVIQGILWGGDFSQVIIDGEVYKNGDKLKNIDARVFKIEKGMVLIYYGEKIYRTKIGKKEEI